MANGLSAAHLRTLAAKCRRIADSIGDEQRSAALKEMEADFCSIADRIERANSNQAQIGNVRRGLE